MRGSYWVLVRKPTGKRPLGRHRRKWEVNIKMDLKEMECGGKDWIHLAQNTQLTGTCECGKETLGSIKGGEFLD